MNVLYKGSFLRDASKLNDRLIKKSIVEVIKIVKSASSISKINRLVKLRKYKVHYRIEIEGNYRIGLIVRSGKVWFVRVLHRSKIYKEFP
jgi:mRNA interferase RelE/StbE